MVGDGTSQRLDGLPVGGVILTKLALRKIGRIEKLLSKLALYRANPLLRSVDGRSDLAPFCEIAVITTRRSR